MQQLLAVRLAGRPGAEHPLGLPLMGAKALSTSSPVTLEKSVPFGKNSLMRPFAFSTVPLCRGLWGRQR